MKKKKTKQNKTKISKCNLRNGKRAACNHRVTDAQRRLLGTKEAQELIEA